MALKYLTNIDLSQNQLQKATFEKLTTAPTSPTPVAGQMYYNTTDQRAYIYNGSVWVGMDGVGATMTGDNIVTAINGSTSTINVANLDSSVITSTELSTALSGYSTTSHNHTLDSLSNITIADKASGQFIKWNGTAWINTALLTTDIPTLNQNTTGTAANVTGVVAITNGGTGQTTKTAAFDALSPTTTLGDIIYDNGTNAVRLAGNTTTTKKFLRETGTGTVSAAPAWDTVTAADVGLGNVINESKATMFASPTFTGTVSGITAAMIGLGNVSNDAQVKKSASSTNGNLVTWSGTTGDALGTGYSVQTVLSSSTTAIPRADAVINYVDSLLAASDAMIYKGTLGTGGTITSLPTTYNAGWSYKVITAGTYVGTVCEIGDLIIAVVDRTGSGNLNSDWTVVQTNIDGVVTGPASSVNNNFAAFDQTTGKLIKDSGYNATSFSCRSDSEICNYFKHFCYNLYCHS